MNLKKFGYILLCCLSTTMYARQKSAAEIVDSIKTQYAPDKRVSVWSVETRESDNGLLLIGKVDQPQAKAALLQSLESYDYKVIDALDVLPSKKMEKKWALVTISVACMRAEPRSGSELVSQAIMGTPMRVLEDHDGMVLVQTPDNYLGYMTTSSIQMLNDAEFAEWKQSKRYIVTSCNAYIYSNAKEDEDNIVADVTLGNILTLKEKKSDFFLVALPDGRCGYIHKSKVMDLVQWAEQPFDINLIERNAKRMLGTPYLWGGMSTKMVDCSGFVKTLYFSNGIILQRDASQQAKNGKIIDWKSWQDEAQKGDLIFIGSKKGRVTHVAMYLEDGKYIHSSGRVKINSMNPKDEDFLDYTFISMSRINGQVNTTGITSVKSHPWYF